MFSPELLAFTQRALLSIESTLIVKHGWSKAWTTLLSTDLKSSGDEDRFHIQRIGCDPPTIEVSLLYFLSLHSTRPSERERRMNQFILHFTDAIRHAQDMARTPVFLSPSQARVIKAEAERAKRAEIRDTQGVLPDRFFTVKWIAVVSEIATPEHSQVAIMQSIEHPTTYEMVREGKRQLTERILGNERLAETLEIIEQVQVDPTPTKVVIAARDGAIHQTVSYEALGGNVIPLSDP